LRTGTSGVESLPDDTFAKAGVLALDRSFPGTSTTDPAQVVISGDIESGTVTAAIAHFRKSIADDQDFGPPRQQTSDNGQVALISIPLVGDPDHSQARRGLERLRTELIPAAFDGTGASVLVGGTTAENVDYSDVINHWLPIVLVFVLALSMDYHVFLLSRVRERFAQTGDTNQAVVHGIAATGRIITGAALIIVVVFAGFAAGQLVMFQQMGFGVGVALLVDATLIRMVVVPAAMALLGRWNWYLPSWLNWLPELHVEGDPVAPTPASDARPSVPEPA
jgi:uncharacterized membrane protein YdfJ with MMPL/SSD domain